MKNEELLLRRFIREHVFLLNEEGQLTVGDMKKALELSKKQGAKQALANVSKEAGKKVASAGLKWALSLIPGAAGIADAIETGMEIKDLYAAAQNATPEEKKKNPLWDILTIDPGTSKIVDDAIEANFIKNMSTRIEKLSDDMPVPNIDDQLNNYFKSQEEFRGSQITKSK
jgi:hypothetical protein